jgi:hypothetical protein
MADIFVSYKKEDAGRVVRIVEQLRAEGYSVWWDHGLAAGQRWDETIKHELTTAKVVCVMWSEQSVVAPWVKEEAAIAKAQGTLAPVFIDKVDPPFGFSLYQAADLIGWDGDVSDPRWAKFLAAVKSVMTGEAQIVPEAVSRKKKLPIGVIAGLAAVALALVLGFGWWTTSTNTLAPAPGGQPRAGGVAIPGLPAPTAAVTAAEQAMWDKATAEKTRQAFQTYLVSFPNGAFANRARDALLTCRSETKEVWKPGPDVANQMVRGVGSVPDNGKTPKEACAKAKKDIEAQAKLMCETITTNGGYRNAKWTVQDRDCACDSPNPNVTICIADLPYSCRWEMKVNETLEICGG